MHRMDLYREARRGGWLYKSVILAVTMLWPFFLLPQCLSHERGHFGFPIFFVKVKDQWCKFFGPAISRHLSAGVESSCPSIRNIAAYRKLSHPMIF
jgi:hypothetical protein